MKTETVRANRNPQSVKRLSYAAAVIVVACSIKLGFVAAETDNWKGFGFSVFQLVFVGAAVVMLLKKSAADDKGGDA